MNENLILSWTGSSRSAAGIGGMLSNPDWASVEERLDQSVRLGGTVALDSEDENGCSRSLQVRGENGRFIVTFGIENLQSKQTRLGTYDKNLNKIGD